MFYHITHKADNGTFELLYIEDIYFFGVNTRYISLNVLKISVISLVLRTREITDISNA